MQTKRKESTKPNAERLNRAFSVLEASKMLAPTYSIEITTNTEEYVEVTFLDQLTGDASEQGDWQEIIITKSELEAFVKETYKIDAFYNDVTIASYLEDHLTVVIKAYLESGKELCHV